MGVENGDEGGRVRFVEVPNYGDYEIAGVQLPKCGVFLDQNGEVIPLVLDEADSFARMTRGLIFSKAQGFGALKEPTLKDMTTNVERKLLHDEIKWTSLPRRKRGPLERALLEFNRPMWGICDDHLHVYLRGEIMHPSGRPSAACSIIGASLLALRLMAQGFFSFESAARLLNELGSERLQGLPLKDPPPRFGMVVMVLRG